MSYSKKKIIKKTVQGNQNVHIGEHIASLKEAYVHQTTQRKLEECNKEIEKYRLQEMLKVMDEVDKIKEEAYQSGKNQAKEEALLELRSDTEMTVRREWENRFSQLDSIYEEANIYLKEEKQKIDLKKELWIRENEEDLTQIIMESVKKLLQRESLETSPEQIKKLIQSSLNEVKDKSATIWIRVHPVIRKKIDAQNWDERNIEWIADPKLNESDVLVETESEWIDSTIQNKIENLKKIIEEWVLDNELIR